LLATILGQDLEATEDGTFKIARRVAKDRIISTVDPETRHGHKTAARGFDGYKSHRAIDPDSEIITETVVTPGNQGDASAAETLVTDLTGKGRGDRAGGYRRRRSRAVRATRSPRRQGPSERGPSTRGVALWHEEVEEGKRQEAGGGCPCCPPPGEHEGARRQESSASARR